MPQKIIIYGDYDGGIFDIANVFHLPSGALPGLAADVANDIADALSNIVSNHWIWHRWEHISAAGVKIDEGTMTVAGLVGGEYLGINLCYLLRLISGGPKHPSLKYVHGVPEGMLSNGGLSAGGVTAMAAVSTGLASIGVVDSDSYDITGVTFRYITRRRKLARKTA